MSFLFATLFSLVAAASDSPRMALPPGPEAQVARTYMRMVQSANAFDVDDAIEARDTLLNLHGDALDRVGISNQLAALMVLGEPLAVRQIDWWQGRMPEKDERYLIVWWHPDRSASRRVVLGAQAVGDLHGITVVAMVPDGTDFDRKAAASIVAICPNITFASAPRKILDEVDLLEVPQLTVVDEGEVIWQGTWEQLRFTPLSP